jgi:V-type H+-transporting ATPase subunit C
VPAQRYIQQFAWDSAKYPNRRPLKELVAMIAGGAAGIDEELKQLTQSFVDKQAALADAKRKSGGNLMVADLNDTLDEETMRQVKTYDSEYLKTVFVAIPKGAKENFIKTVETLAGDAVGYGGPDWSTDPSNLGGPVSFGQQIDRQKVRGSPVVPGSVQLVKADEETILYAVTILKGQYEAGYFEGSDFHPGTLKDFETDFAQACREKRYVLREFKWDGSQASRSAMAREQLQVEVDGMKSALMRWCKTHYGDAFVAWMHIKAIRVFVESVLRYGLPVDFTSVLYKVNNGKDQQLTKALDKALGSAVVPEDDAGDDLEEYHDFVLIKFDP